MARPRAIWKGTLQLAELGCAVALFAAASTSERVAFHIVNRKTGHRVHRHYVDEETGRPVAPDDQVKGYETAKGRFVILEPEQVAAAVPHTDKILHVEGFVGCGDIDAVYFDWPYYVAPADTASRETFVLLREGMRKTAAAALARTVLFRRVRTLLVRAHGSGMIATTLNFDYEVRSARQAFAKAPHGRPKGEMLELARHIIATKTGRFDPSKFDDRYDKALADLVKAKLAGREIAPPEEPEVTKRSDLLDALRASANRRRPPPRRTASRLQSTGSKRKVAKPRRARRKAS